MFLGEDRLLDLSFELSRRDLKTLAHPIICEVRHLLRKALEKAKLSKKDIDEIVLEGGMTSMQAVKDAVGEYFNNDRILRIMPEPDQHAAIGAFMAAQFKYASPESNRFHFKRGFSNTKHTREELIDIFAEDLKS